jgi:hypothetical protein
VYQGKCLANGQLCETLFENLELGMKNQTKIIVKRLRGQESKIRKIHIVVNPVFLKLLSPKTLSNEQKKIATLHYLFIDMSVSNRGGRKLGVTKGLLFWDKQKLHP